MRAIPLLNSAWLPWASVAAALLAGVWPSAALAQADLVEREEQAMKAAVARAAPSVLKIETFGGLEKVGDFVAGSGPTTGLVVSAEGHVLSSAFAFVQMPASILATLPSGKRAAAQIVARDHARMLVLLKVTTDEKLTPAAPAPRGEWRVGQWTIAVGRAYDAPEPNVSVGVLSAIDRVWGKAVQTDAKISPSNYGGPLVDIRGRVIGVLAPMSPQQENAIAGAEWYDSGIGFAVPLEDVLRRLDKLKAGQDQHQGLLGVSLKQGDLNAAAEIAAAPLLSPAEKAGLKAGDVIVEIDGRPIKRQNQLKHALGAKYAGEQVKVVVTRGGQRVEATIELTDKLKPYEHPFLGVLPARGVPKQPPGAVARHVYPNSPAATAGVQVGDRLVKVGDKAIPNGESLPDLLAAWQPGDKVRLELLRGETPHTVEAALGSLPTDIPAELPPALAGKPPEGGERPAVGEVEIKLPEDKNACLAYVPENYHPDVAHGLVVWLHPAGAFDKDKLLARWKQACADQRLILLAPQAADPAKWQPTEVEFVGKAIEQVLANYNVDRARVAALGSQAGGAMAYLCAFGQRERIHAVAALDAAVPRRVKIPDNEPVGRLAVYTTTSKAGPLKADIAAGVEQLRQRKYPVTVKDLGETQRELNDAEFAELLRWLDTLDRA